MGGNLSTLGTVGDDCLRTVVMMRHELYSIERGQRIVVQFDDNALDMMTRCGNHIGITDRRICRRYFFEGEPVVAQNRASAHQRRLIVLQAVAKLGFAHIRAVRKIEGHCSPSQSRE